MSAKPRLLCVDDEPELLNGLRLTLRKHYAVTTAESGSEALALFAEDGGGASPFDVVVSDMRMPGMTGAQLLAALEERHPDVPRLLLSGQSDLDSAIAAINDAKIFRFLTKPCPPELLIESLDEALEQARLRDVERELLDKTLSGTVSMLAEVLGLVSAGAYGRTMRLRETVRGLCAALGQPVPWDLALAAMLSQLGYVVMPSDPEGGSGLELTARHLEITAELLGNIPRLETVVEMIGHQLDPGPRHEGRRREDWSDHDLNTEILRMALHVDQLVAAGRSAQDARKALASSPTPPPEFLLEALGSVRPDTEAKVELGITVRQLAPGMDLAGDVTLATGPKLAGAGTPLTVALVQRIQAFASTHGVVEPIKVLAPASKVAKVMTR
jgi:CheY-like chemotaxis protein